MSPVYDSAEPVVLTLGRGLVEMRFAAMLRGAIFLLGAFAIVSLVRAILGLWANPLWREFSRVASTVIALGIVYFVLDGIVTLMSSVQSGGVSLSTCVGAILRDRRQKLAEIARYGIPILGLAAAWIAVFLLGMAPYVGKPIIVIAWPIRLLVQLGIWLLLARMMVGAVLSPVVRGLKPDLDPSAAGLRVYDRESTTVVQGSRADEDSR